MTKLTAKEAEEIKKAIAEATKGQRWGDEHLKLFRASLEALLEYELERHISIPWKTLPENSPISKFAHEYNYFNDESHEGFEWCEQVLTELSHAKSLDDLKIQTEKPTVGDWYVCAQLLKSGFKIPPELIGELLEKVIEEATTAKLEIQTLGIFKAKRGRPSSEKRRLQYLGWLCWRIDQLITKQGMNLTEAYACIAEEKHKSTDTIRRDYERYMKERRERRKDKYGEK